MKKVKTIVPIALACTTIIAFFSLGATVSYLTDAEATDNIITIGKVELEISEPNFFDEIPSVLAAGGSVTKDPIIKNTGTKDEYVFFRVGVPKREVTLLYEEESTVNGTNYKEGTPTVNNRNAETGEIKSSSDEIYKIIADGVENGATATALDANALKTADSTDVNKKPNGKPQLDFSYNKGDSITENAKTAGWTYLKRELNVKVTEGTGQNARDYYYDYYYFGYNKKLAKGKDTIPLFDRIQLKSFIDEEVNSKDDDDKTLNEETKITIDAYGIQADSLGGTLNSLDEFVGQLDLQKIFNIVKEKKG